MCIRLVGDTPKGVRRNSVEGPQYYDVSVPEEDTRLASVRGLRGKWRGLESIESLAQAGGSNHRPRQWYHQKISNRLPRCLKSTLNPYVNPQPPQAQHFGTCASNSDFDASGGHAGWVPELVTGRIFCEYCRTALATTQENRSGKKRSVDSLNLLVQSHKY